MAVNRLKKINVRSPYYITVDNVQEATVDPTEPVNQEATLTCGSTIQVGVDVGTKIFKIDTTGRELGDYTITFAGIKTPIKFRIGHASNMPSFTTAGLDTYAAEWNTATGESPTLTSPTYDDNDVVGITATATYTSTQGDIDLYGEEIQLEIFQPIITEDYSFSLSCPALAEDTVPVDDGFVVIISFIKNSGKHPESSANTLSVNGTDLGNLPTESGKFTNIDRYVMTDQTPNIYPLSGNNQPVGPGVYSYVYGTYLFATNINTSYFINNNFSNNISAFWKPENILGSGINDLTIVNTGFANSAANMTIQITRHPVRNVSGTNFILGRLDGVAVQGLSVDVELTSGEDFQMTFRGSNSTELEGIEAFKTLNLFEDFEGNAGLGDETQVIPINEFTINPA